MTLISNNDLTVPVTVQTGTTLSPDDAFRIIAPIDLSLVFTGWGPFPGVRGAKNQTGAWDAAGQSRNPDLTDGSTALELLTEYTAPHSFAYEIYKFTNEPFRHALGAPTTTRKQASPRRPGSRTRSQISGTIASTCTKALPCSTFTPTIERAGGASVKNPR